MPTRLAPKAVIPASVEHLIEPLVVAGALADGAESSGVCPGMGGVEGYAAGITAAPVQRQQPHGCRVERADRDRGTEVRAEPTTGAAIRVEAIGVRLHLDHSVGTDPGAGVAAGASIRVDQWGEQAEPASLINRKGAPRR